jgi:hypothetical protein
LTENADAGGVLIHEQLEDFFDKATLPIKDLWFQRHLLWNDRVRLEQVYTREDHFGTQRPRLIVFDNFETPWNAPDESQNQLEISSVSWPG